MKKQFVSPSSTKLPAIPKLVGESRQAPGLKMREQDILHKALGIDQEQDLHPNALKSLVGHPDPKVAAAAKTALSGSPVSKGFSMKAPKGF